MPIAQKLLRHLDYFLNDTNAIKALYVYSIIPIILNEEGQTHESYFGEIKLGAQTGL